MYLAKDKILGEMEVMQMKKENLGVLQCVLHGLYGKKATRDNP